MWHPVTGKEIVTGFHIGQRIQRGDGHRLEIQAIEYFFGNVQVKYYDSFLSKTEWEEINQFRKQLEGKPA